MNEWQRIVSDAARMVYDRDFMAQSDREQVAIADLLFQCVSDRTDVGDLADAISELALAILEKE